MSRIFTLQEPASAEVYLIKSDSYTKGTLRTLNVLARRNKIVIEGKILVPASAAKSMCDLKSKNPEGLFNMRCSTEDDLLDIKRIIGTSLAILYLEGTKWTEVSFSQRCIKGQGFGNVSSDEKDIPKATSKYIRCTTSRPKSPQLGDIYYEPATQKLRMYMFSGWADIQKDVPEAPMIEEEKRMTIPACHATFFCEPLEGRRWDRKISSRRAAKVLEVARKKFG